MNFDTSELSNEFIVSILEDENDGDFSAGDLSLREAIAEAESGDTITFDSNLSGGTITLAGDELTIDKSLTIEGLGAENIIIDGGGSDNNTRVFNINDNSDAELEVVINDLTITGGSSQIGNPGNQDDENPGTGGGIFNLENLVINNANIRDNSAAFGGGGIFSEGTLTVNNSAIYNNSANGVFGSSGGGISNAGTAIINQSTIANNSANARGSGGGILNTGTLSVSNTTVSGNSSGISNQAGILNEGGEATITSTIVAGNNSNNDLEFDINSGGNNLIGGDSISSLDPRGNLVNAQDSDIVGKPDTPFTDNSIDPLLGELQDNGGSTPTITLLEGSPAINAGSNPNNFETDQRGEGFDRTVGNGIDIGALELQTSFPGSDPQDDDDSISTANESGISPDGQQNVVLNDAITFDSDVDLFKLNLEAADVATFNIEAREFGSSLDSVLRVFDSQGNELAFDDDSDAPLEDSSFDSYLEFMAEADGEYFVGVSSFSNFNYDPVGGGNDRGFDSGDYELAISVFDGINGTEGADNLSGGDESDFIQGLDGNDTLLGNGDKDNLLGGSGNDVLTSGDGDDLLQGGDGFDVLRGGSGNDTLSGGDGQNNLYGGEGNDVFALGEGEDTVFDFQDGSDKLLLINNSFASLSISASDTGTTIGSFDNTFATLTGISPDQITSDDIVSPNFLASTFIVDETPQQ